MRRLRKISLWVILVLVLGITMTILFSPYGYKDELGYRAVSFSTEIDAPADSVFKYLGNSANAHYWSSFVDHITPLNNDSFADGTAGARRRCFQHADGSGATWDELITEVVPNKKRQLTIYNMQGFPLKADDLATEQLYQPTGNNKKCKLTFTVFYLHHNPGLFDQLKTYYAAYKIKSIFTHNLENIKRNVESRQTEKQGITTHPN